ncbi:MAG: S8 family serine peptidase [Bacteroidia bacterium]|nr:S8 family serine peptidase [Bacteroidia bacterium]
MTRCIVFCFIGIFFLGSGTPALAQTDQPFCYAVYFKNKPECSTQLLTPSLYLSPRAISRKSAAFIAIDSSDMPVHIPYLEVLDSLGFKVIQKSKWLNCALIRAAKPEDVKQLNNISFIDKVEFLGKVPSPGLNKMVNFSIPQLFNNKKKTELSVHKNGYSKPILALHKIDTLHHQQLTGNGVLIAMLDAGFNYANQHPSLQKAMKQVIATYDIIEQDSNVFNDDEHGLGVWSCIAANDPYYLMGSAPDANYILCRTEDAAYEFPIEEFYWMIGAEFADSCGADLINSSLGYNEFDDTQFNYSYRSLDGKTSTITKGASIAIRKGIFVINSAGNEGNQDWKFISVPADEPAVVTVGATDANGNYATFSSIGFTADNRIKPDAMAVGDRIPIAGKDGLFYFGSGTSYACPVYTGGIACIWPQFKKLTLQQQLKYIHLSSSEYNKPNIYLGYGVTDFYLLYKYSLPYSTDTIISINLNPTNTINLSLHLKSTQKVSISVVDAKGNIIHIDDFLLSEGISRTQLALKAKLNTFVKLQVKTATTILSVPLHN